MSGPPPKPAEQKRRLGNPGKRKLPEMGAVAPLQAARGLVEPVRPLNQPGRELWDRVWGAGKAWVSPDTDLELVQMVCEAVDERHALRRKVLRDGDWHERKALRALDDQVVAGLSLLGMTPADRARFGFAEVKQEDDFDRFRARQTARRSGGGVGS